MNNAFSRYHPLVNFSYFFSVILFSMFLRHPVFLAVSVVTAFMYSVRLNGKKAVKFNLLYLLPLLIFSAVINPLFNHEGVTILAYFKSGNPLTLESIIYGFAQALIIVSVILWFSCFNAVITSDKFIYLFGRIIPSMSLILSMILRFIPKLKRQFKEIKNAQKCINNSESKTVIGKIKEFSRIMSVMVSWSLENAVDTADSMKSRGYGIKGRTSFSLYTLERKDILALIFIFTAAAYVLWSLRLGALQFSYVPITDKIILTPYTVSTYFSYFILCIFPIITELKEDYKWKSLKLKT